MEGRKLILDTEYLRGGLACHCVGGTKATIGSDKLARLLVPVWKSPSQNYMDLAV
jgi:hypothetical protein